MQSCCHICRAMSHKVVKQRRQTHLITYALALMTCHLTIEAALSGAERAHTTPNGKVEAFKGDVAPGESLKKCQGESRNSPCILLLTQSFHTGTSTNRPNFTMNSMQCAHPAPSRVIRTQADSYLTQPYKQSIKCVMM